MYATSLAEVQAAIGVAHTSPAIAEAIYWRASEFARTEVPLRELLAGDIGLPTTGLALEAVVAAASWADAMPTGIDVAADLDDLFDDAGFKPRLLARPLELPGFSPHGYTRFLSIDDATIVCRTWLAKETEEPAEFTEFAQDYLTVLDLALRADRPQPEIVLFSPSYALQRRRDPEPTWPPKLVPRSSSPEFLDAVAQIVSDVSAVSRDD